MTYGQLGWIDALGFGFGMLLEIPSGAVADLLGKRKTILFGLLSGAMGVVLITFSGSLTGIFIGWLITQICFAFYSGAAEALAYDTLVDLKKEHEYDRIISRNSEIESYTGAITTFLGGFLYVVNFRLPHMFWGLSFLVGAIFAYFLIEPKVDTEKFSGKKYFRQLGVGFMELTQPALRKYIGFFFALIGVYFLYSWGFIRPAMATSFGFFAEYQAVILPLLALLGALVVRTIPWLKPRISEFKGLLVLSLIMVVGFFAASFPIGYFGIIPMILIAIAGYLATPWVSIIVNKNIQSRYRATTLSTLALITKIPYVLIAVLAGKLIEEGRLATFTLSTSGIILFVAVVSTLYVIFSKKSKVRKLSY